MKLKVYTFDGSQSVEKEFDGIETFEGDKGLQAVKQVVVAHRANARQGTRSTKTRGEVRGGGKKPFKQKGTGRARAGSTRSPLWSGGGVVFGPRPRDFSQKINEKVKSLALKRAFFDRVIAGEIEIIERFEAAPAKTKVISQLMGRIAPEGKVLIVDAPFAQDVRQAARNIERLTTQDAAMLNTLDLCQYRKLILSEKALENVLARMKGGN
ncbi:MAG: 50S ribosomal protein L4 [Opitutaceae bacterium]|nr:50S ribosomal protein L4 [Opitutaceae bacterium]